MDIGIPHHAMQCAVLVTVHQELFALHFNLAMFVFAENHKQLWLQNESVSKVMHCYNIEACVKSTELITAKITQNIKAAEFIRFMVLIPGNFNMMQSNPQFARMPQQQYPMMSGANPVVQQGNMMMAGQRAGYPMYMNPGQMNQVC